MKVAILTIGDEICIGQIVNTNAAWMAQQCSQVGMDVVAHSATGDSVHSILAEFERLLALADVLLITGGLGPTHDDCTRDALLAYFEDELVVNQEALRHIRELLERRGLSLTERQRDQAMVPRKCQALLNPRGTAPGMLFRTESGKVVAAMPGVPVEMKFIMSEYIIPLLKEESREDSVLMYSTLLSTGIAEANLADLIGNVHEITNGHSLAFLPSARGVRLRIGVRAQNREEGEQLLSAIEQRVRDKAGKYIYGKNDETLSSVIGKLLSERGQQLAVAESCTGGLLGKYITDIPGSSAYFLGGVLVYSNQAKAELLNVPVDILETRGAVSKETAELLAANVRDLFRTDYGIGITGVAGPGGGSPEKPVGTIWIAVAARDSVTALKFHFGKDREVNRERAVAAALALLYRIMLNE